MIETLRQELKDDGYAVSISQLCRRFSVPCCTVYYEAPKKPPTVQERFAHPTKQMLEEHPSFQLMHWQVCKRPVASSHAFERAGTGPASFGQRVFTSRS